MSTNSLLNILVARKDSSTYLGDISILKLRFEL